MQHLSVHLDNPIKNQPGSLRASGSGPSTPPRPSARSKELLSQLLEKICALQKTYGKTQAELETLVEGFSWALAGYSMDEINRGFQRYVVSHNDIPAPADIIKIIADFRLYDDVTPAGVEQLRQYKAKGIPLTPKQEEALRQSAASGEQGGRS